MVDNPLPIIIEEEGVEVTAARRILNFIGAAITAVDNPANARVNITVAASPGLDTTAIHDNIAAEISAIAAKANPVGTDLMVIEDSAAANAKKSAQLSAAVNGAGAVMESDFDAATFLYATNNNTPQKKTPIEVMAILSGQAGAAFGFNNQIVQAMKGMTLTDFLEITISGGAITVTQMCHSVDTEGDAASDDLDTINGGGTVDMIVIRPNNDARTIVVKHNTGNIWLQGGSDVTLDDVSDSLLLVYDNDNSKWVDIAAGGGGASTFLALTDAPASYVGQAGLGLKVNSGESALEFVERGWEVVSNQVLASDATTITFTNLDLDAHTLYDFHMAIQEGSGVNNNYRMFFNTDTTSTNYYTQYITADAGVLSSGRLNAPYIMGIDASLESVFHFTIERDPGGYVRWLMKCGLRHDPAACGMRYYGGIWTTTGSNVTRIDFTAAVANGFGAGSKITMFRLRQ